MKWTLLLVLFTLFTSLFAVSDGNKDVPKVPVKLTNSFLSSESILVLNFTNHPGWHTYWKNPGDAGLEIKTKFFINQEEVKLEPLEWPVPKRYFEKGNILAYGYEGSYSLFFKVPKEVLSQKGKQLKVSANWLVCKHICIPGTKEFTIAIQDGLSESEKELTQKEIQKRFKKLPQQKEIPSYLDLTLSLNEEKDGFVFLYNVSKDGKKLRSNLNLLTPFPHELFDFKHEKLSKDKSNSLYAQLPSDWDGEYAEPEVPLPTDGIFKTPQKVSFLFNDPLNGEVYKITKEFKQFNPESYKQMVGFFSMLKPFNNQSGEAKKLVNDQSSDSSAKSLWYFLALAFIGGLILNIMPCVLPVISIKLFGLVKHSQESNTKILRHNIFYTLGVLFTFAILASVIIALKSAGTSVGWGFQLQSPKFILVMIFVLLIFTFNLFGLFEFRTPGGSKLGGLRLEEGMAGDFMSGILATILSTPCSAPFLGTALTFAFTSSSTSIFLIFMSIGLGLAFPFLLTGFFPSTIKIFPKPGMWMEHIKKFLGLTLILTIIWLVDVFSAQVDTNLHVIKLNTAMALMFFAFYFKAKISNKLIPLLLVFAFPLFFIGSILNSNLSSLETTSDLVMIKKSEGLNWEPWSISKMQEYQDSGQKVFIDFTAKWCFTCKVNEKLVINTKSFKQYAAENDIKLLLGDWTKRDPVIGDWLKSQGLVGVPAYFTIKDGKLTNLGETITLTKIKNAFN